MNILNASCRELMEELQNRKRTTTKYNKFRLQNEGRQLLGRKIQA
jgi:hypothetical protein